MKHTKLTDKEIIALWRNRSGPINLYHCLDPDTSYPCISKVEFGLNDRNESYITQVTLPDRNGTGFVVAGPEQIYTGELIKKNFGMYQKS